MYSWISLETAAQGLTPGLVPEARALREMLGRFATGVCLVTTVTPAGKREGMTINSFTSVSLAPPLVLWSIANEARSSPAFIGADAFCISVLGAEQKAVALHFARASEDKFAGFEADFTTGDNGVPRLRSALATYECSAFSRHREGDHTLLVGRITRFDGAAAEPLLFHAGKMGTPAELSAQPA